MLDLLTFMRFGSKLRCLEGDLGFCVEPRVFILIAYLTSEIDTSPFKARNLKFGK